MALLGSIFIPFSTQIRDCFSIPDDPPPITEAQEDDEAFGDNAQIVAAPTIGFHPNHNHRDPTIYRDDKDMKDKATAIHFYRFNHLPENSMRACCNFSADGMHKFTVDRKYCNDKAKIYQNRMMGLPNPKKPYETYWLVAFVKNHVQSYNAWTFLWNLSVEWHVHDLKSRGTVQDATQQVQNEAAGALRDALGIAFDSFKAKWISSVQAKIAELEKKIKDQNDKKRMGEETDETKEQRVLNKIDLKQAKITEDKLVAYNTLPLARGRYDRETDLPEREPFYHEILHQKKADFWESKFTLKEAWKFYSVLRPTVAIRANFADDNMCTLMTTTFVHACGDVWDLYVAPRLRNERMMNNQDQDARKATWKTNDATIHARFRDINKNHFKRMPNFPSSIEKVLVAATTVGTPKKRPRPVEEDETPTFGVIVKKRR